MTETPFRDCTVGELLRRARTAFPELEALVSPERSVRWTFERLDEEADRVAAACLAAGLEAGDRAVVWAANLPEWVAIQYGLARAGVVLVTANGNDLASVRLDENSAGGLADRAGCDVLTVCHG